MSDAKAVTMVTREEPRFVQFGTGEIIEGLLVSIDRIQIKGKGAVRYTVQEDGGQLVAFLGTYQINTKLHHEDRGHRVSIKCIGEDVMVKRGENCMKVFEVAVSTECIQAGAISTLEISNDDIPF
jgi:hypothetical protein